VVLNINTDLSTKDTGGFIAEQFLPGEQAAAYALWADDEYKRVFTPVERTTDFFIAMHKGG
jgi:hypothetical protein